MLSIEEVKENILEGIKQAGGSTKYVTMSYAVLKKICKGRKAQYDEAIKQLVDEGKVSIIVKNPTDIFGFAKYKVIEQ